MGSLRQGTLTAVLRNVPILMFAGTFVVFGLLAPRFLQYQSLENIAKQASYIGIIAVGETVVLLTAGIDLSVGSNMYVSAVAAGLLMERFSISPLPALLVCLVVGLLFGLLNAFAVTRLHIIPFVVTLATQFAGRGLGWMLSKSRAVTFPQSVTGLGAAELLGIPVPVVIFAVVVLVAWVVLTRTTLGRQIYAVGHGLEAARKAGVDTRRVQATAYVICGVLASLGGFISVAQLGNVNSGFGQMVEFQAIAAAVLGGASLFGGIGNVFPGTVLGALLIQMVWAGLVATRTDLYLQPLIAAAIIFLAVLLDSVRNTVLARLGRHNIRVEE
ncbi:MAG: ABC transporter permease [Planctomycetota bacterium]|nr:ABC transporter permease [Planctomycetota bacterium]